MMNFWKRFAVLGEMEGSRVIRIPAKPVKRNFLPKKKFRLTGGKPQKNRKNIRTLLLYGFSCPSSSNKYLFPITIGMQTSPCVNFWKQDAVLGRVLSDLSWSSQEPENQPRNPKTSPKDIFVEKVPFDWFRASNAKKMFELCCCTVSLFLPALIFTYINQRMEYKPVAVWNFWKQVPCLGRFGVVWLEAASQEPENQPRKV